MISWFKRYDMTPTTAGLLILLWVFFIAFMLYPLVFVFSSAFFTAEGFSLVYFKLMMTSPNYTTILANSINLGLTVTLLTTLLSLPLAFLLVRYDFPGKVLLNGFILIPLVLPPFVGAIGMRQLLARFGSVNLLLLQMGVIDQPIDWLGGGFAGVIVLEVLHLYPIMYLNLAAALANVDPSVEEAARNMGANGFRLFRTVTFPLMLPGYFAGAIIVFIWAFTDLGTPLVFEYRELISVQIFNLVTDLHQNSMGYAFVVAVIVITLLFFYVSKRLIGGNGYAMLGRGHVASAVRPASTSLTVLIYAVVLGISAVALIPHLGVLLTSITARWFLTVLPTEYTFRFYREIFVHDLTLLSIKNSLFLSSLSTVIDIVLGVTIAYLLARKRVPGRDVMDALAMLPLALPGLVMAFG
jgi:iron(III) transport system permease protein